MKLYITNLSLYVLIFLYLPVVVWALWRVWRSPQLRGVWKAGAMLLAALVAYAIPLGDVTINSLAMARVCPSAGLHVYKTVEVDGYLTTIGDGGALKRHPYKFIETPQLKADGAYYWIRYEKNQDGSVVEKRLDKSTAVYEVLGGQWHIDYARGVEVTTDVIRRKETGEVLADINLFNALPGWLDRALVVRWFGAGGRHDCWGEPASMVDVARILIPKQLNK
jgi:hypothetical protein